MLVGRSMRSDGCGTAVGWDGVVENPVYGGGNTAIGTGVFMCVMDATGFCGAASCFFPQVIRSANPFKGYPFKAVMARIASAWYRYCTNPQRLFLGILTLLTGPIRQKRANNSAGVTSFDNPPTNKVVGPSDGSGGGWKGRDSPEYDFPVSVESGASAFFFLRSRAVAWLTRNNLPSSSIPLHWAIAFCTSALSEKCTKPYPRFRPSESLRMRARTKLSNLSRKNSENTSSVTVYAISPTNTLKSMSADLSALDSSYESDGDCASEGSMDNAVTVSFFSR